MALDDTPGKPDIASENAPLLHPYTRRAYEKFVEALERSDGSVRAASMYWCVILALVASFFLRGVATYLQTTVLKLPMMFGSHPMVQRPIGVFLFVLSGCALLPLFAGRLVEWKRVIGFAPPSDAGKWRTALGWLAGLLVLEIVVFGILYRFRESGSLFVGMSNAFMYDFEIGPQFAPTATKVFTVLKVFGWLFLAPVFHEICFRGIGMAGYLRTGTPGRAIFWTTVVGAVVRGSPFLFPMTLVASFFYGVIRVRTGSVYCSLAAHCLNNLGMTAFLWGYMYHWYL